MTDLSDLETLVAVATSGSFAKAARRLSISPAMVGRRIQTLEDRYNTKLIERSTRSQRLTPVGKDFLLMATQIIESFDALNDLARPDTGHLSGRIRVTGPTTLGINRLTQIAASFTTQHPDVAIELNLNDRSVDLISGGYDLAVRIGELTPSSMIARRVGTYRFVCCASPAYIQHQGSPDSPTDLLRASCVLDLNLVPRNRWPFLDSTGTPFTVEVRGNLEIDYGEALRSAALAGAGIIYAPLDLVEDELKSGLLVQVLPKWQTMTLPIHTLHPSRRQVPRRVSAFIEAVAQAMKNTETAVPSAQIQTNS